jgi:actin cytoskeleton-regulatory complex protein SLA1
MGFLGIYRALYDYTPQGEGELAIIEGDILYVLEKSGEDDWWRAKKKASGDDDDEPVGLIPSNYIEEVRPMLAHQLQHISVGNVPRISSHP